MDISSICVHQYTNNAGDFAKNYARASECYRSHSAALHLFPVSFLSGDNLYDCVRYSDFLKQNTLYLDKLTKLTAEKPDAILLNSLDERGKKLTFFLSKGARILIKSRIDGLNGVAIVTGTRMPKDKVVIVLRNIPYDSSFLALIKKMERHAKLYNSVIINVNQFCVCDDLYYPGFSGFITSSGHNLLQISEGTIFYKEIAPAIKMSKNALDYEVAISALRKYLAQTTMSGVVLGVSGGIDSALSLAMTVDAIGSDKALALLLPTKYNDIKGIEHAKQYCEKMGVSYHIIEIDDLFDLFMHKLGLCMGDLSGHVAAENIQSRVRGIVLMAFSNKLNYLLLNSGNKTELMLGYCTLYGDMCGGYSLTADLYKKDIYRLAKWRNKNIPASSCNKISAPISEYFITRKPTAELRHQQIDEDDLPMHDYGKIDEVLNCTIDRRQTIDRSDYNITDVNQLLDRFVVSELKRRQACLGLKISDSAHHQLPVNCKFSWK